MRLPAEAEWERAATAARGEYPWGAEEPDPERANFDQNVDAPTPVGIYPAGDGPFGHCDLAGNAWEWCADRIEMEDPREWRVLRGGGWFGPAEALRSAIRVRVRAGYRLDAGFCVAAAPASILKP